MSLIMTNQQHQVKLPPQLEVKLEKIVQMGLEIEGVDSSAEVSLVFVDDQEIQILNKTYRQKDQPTDVLSFPLWDGEEEASGEILLGDIVISLETAQRQAEEYGHSLEREIAYLMVHGLLHLLGYDHLTLKKTSYATKEEEILHAIDLYR